MSQTIVDAERDIAGVPKERDTQGKTKQLPNSDIEIPRPFQIPSQKLLEPSQSPTLNLPKSLHFWSPNPFQNPSKTIPRTSQGPKNRSRGAQETQEVPKRRPRAFQGRPRSVQEAPKNVQVAPKSLPNPSKMEPRGGCFLFLSICWAFISHLCSKSRFEGLFLRFFIEFSSFWKGVGKVLGGRVSHFLVCTSQMAILKKPQKTSTGAIKSKVRALTESIHVLNVQTLKIVFFPK